MPVSGVWEESYFSVLSLVQESSGDVMFGEFQFWPQAFTNIHHGLFRSLSLK